MASLTPGACRVNLKDKEEKNRWKDLAKLPCRVARYPCPETLQLLRLKQCFDKLCTDGDLTVLFTGSIPSYQRLTLEFLTTLQVEMRRKEIVAITFRLRNTEYRMTMAEFKELYGFSGAEFGEPHNFKKNAFWQAITTRREDFKANRAKGSMIRNLVLRIIQRACVLVPFARNEQGSVQSDELFLLWSILNKRPNSWLGDEQPEAMMDDEQEDDDEEEEEEAPRTEVHGEGTSNPRTMGRVQRLEDDIASINDRVGNFEASMQEMSDRKEDHCKKFNALYDERWKTYMNHYEEFKGYWVPPPPPEE